MFAPVQCSLHNFHERPQGARAAFNPPNFDRRSWQTCVTLSAISSDKGFEPLTYDPEGLFADKPVGGLFARKGLATPPPAAATSPPAAAAAASLPRTQSLPSQYVAQGGVAAAEPVPGVYSPDALAKVMQRHMPVKLCHPGVKVQHVDPPIFTVEGFFTAQECQALISAAADSGVMEVSRVGGSNVAYAGVSLRRTSSSVLVTDDVLQQQSALQAPVTWLQDRGRKLFDIQEAWGPSGQLPAPGQYCFEALQVAEYQTGQYFLEHEDAFPVEMARENGFNRHATLLVYLNDVPKGGRTCFNNLGLAIQPKQGTALLFFPSFRDGTPDPRTLHTAEDAEDVKWVTQQWIARGLGGIDASKGLQTQMLADSSQADELQIEKAVALRRSGKRTKAGQQHKSKKTGFG